MQNPLVVLRRIIAISSAPGDRQDERAWRCGRPPAHPGGGDIGSGAVGPALCER